MANFLQNLFGPVAPGVSSTINPISMLGAGVYSGNPAGALAQMGQMQIASQQLQAQQAHNQQRIALMQAEAQREAAQRTAQQRAAMALVNPVAGMLGPGILEEQRQALATIAQGSPETLLTAYGTGKGPFEKRPAGFEGTGITSQAYNTLLELGPKMRDGTASKLQQQKYNLAYQHASRPTSVVTPEGTFTQPPVNLSQFPTPAGMQTQAGGPPGFTPKPLTAGEYKEQTTTEITSRLVSEIDAALEAGAETGPVAAGKAYAAATPWLSWAVKLAPQEAKLASNLAALEKMLIAAMRGAQVGPQEEASFRRTLPSLGQEDELFDANLQTTKQNIADLMRRGEERQRTSQSDGQPVTIANDAEFDALPSGALFVGPDGVERRKP